MIGSKLKPKDAYGSALEPLKGTFRCESLFPRLSTVSTRMATPTRLSCSGAAMVKLCTEVLDEHNAADATPLEVPRVNYPTHPLFTRAG